jgi:hypothetical protein
MYHLQRQGKVVLKDASGVSVGTDVSNGVFDSPTFKGLGITPALFFKFSQSQNQDENKICIGFKGNIRFRIKCGIGLNKNL